MNDILWDKTSSLKWCRLSALIDRPSALSTNGHPWPAKILAS